MWFDGAFLISCDYNKENPEFFASVFFDTSKADLREAIIIVPTNKYKDLRIVLNKEHSTPDKVRWDSPNSLCFWLEITRKVYMEMRALAVSDTTHDVLSL